VAWARYKTRNAKNKIKTNILGQFLLISYHL